MPPFGRRIANAILARRRAVMSRTMWIAAVGFCVVAVGAVLMLSAGSLATRWESLGPEVWGGTTDPGLRQTYYRFGLVGVGFGLLLLGMAAWQWVATYRGQRPA